MQMVCFRFLILHESNFAVWSLRRLLGLQLRQGRADGVKLGASTLVNVVLVVENVVHFLLDAHDFILNARQAVRRVGYADEVTERDEYPHDGNIHLDGCLRNPILAELDVAFCDVQFVVS